MTAAGSAPKPRSGQGSAPMSVRTLVPLADTEVTPSTRPQPRPEMVSRLRGAGVGLPLPRLEVASGESAVCYAVSAVDVWGRIADRAPVRALRWPAGWRVRMTILPRAVLVTADPAGGHAITRQGHLRLPATARHVLRLRAGQRLLLASCLDGGFIVVLPTTVLDAVVTAHRISATDGGLP